MIDPKEIINLIQADLPGADVQVLDKTGMSDHFIIRVTAVQFKDLNPLDRHRRVMASLQAAMSEGRLHAVELQTAVPAGA